MAEITATQLLLQARGGCEKMAEGLAKQLVHKLEHIQGLTNADAVKLFEHIQASNLPSSMISILRDTLDVIVLGGNSAVTTTMSAQRIDGLPNFLRASDWQKLHSASMWEGADTLCHRLKMLGVHTLKECTKRTCVGILLCMELERTGKLPAYITIYELVQHLVQLDSCTTETPLEVQSLQVYPKDPSSLGAKAMQLIYGDEKAEPKVLEKLPLLVNHHIPVRSTSKLLQGCLTSKKKSGLSMAKSQAAPSQESQTMTLQLPNMEALPASSFNQHMQSWLANQQKLFNQGPAPIQMLPHANQQIVPMPAAATPGGERSMVATQPGQTAGWSCSRAAIRVT